MKSIYIPVQNSRRLIQKPRSVGNRPCNSHDVETSSGAALCTVYRYFRSYNETGKYLGKCSLTLDAMPLLHHSNFTHFVDAVMYASYENNKSPFKSFNIFKTDSPFTIVAKPYIL